MMREEFGAFRAFLFPTQTELVRFRQLVVNVSGAILYNNRYNCLVPHLLLTICIS